MAAIGLQFNVGGSMASTSQGQNLKKRKRAEGRNSIPSNKMTKAIVASGGASNGAGSSSAFDEELEQQLLPTAEEGSDLARVIKMLDNQGVSTEKLPEEAGVSTFLEALQGPTIHPVSSLEFFLELASSAAKARASRSHSNKESQSGMHVEASTSGASTSYVPASNLRSVQIDIDNFANTVQAIFADMKEMAAARLGKKRVKRISKPKYALHRSIGTSYDVFSSVTDSIPADDKTWQQLGDTDLLAVYPTELAETSTAPRLGDSNGVFPMSTKRAIELQPQIEPVSFLYYDPYQSFAPTYDSSTATLSYAQSVSLRESRQTAQEWSNQPLPPLPPQDLPAPIRPPLEDTLASIDPSLFTANDVESIDSSEMRLYLRMMEDSQVFDQRLKENTELLRALQEAQWHRLRKSETTASDVELKSAQRLLESLTSLANARPRTPDIPENASPFTSNPFTSASIVQSKPRAYYGILDKANSKGIPDYVMAKDAYGMKEGSNPAVPPELSRKNSAQSGKKSKKSHKAKQAAQQNGTSASPAVQSTELPGTSQVKQETPAV